MLRLTILFCLLFFFVSNSIGADSFSDACNKKIEENVDQEEKTFPLKTKIKRFKNKLSDKFQKIRNQLLLKRLLRNNDYKFWIWSVLFLLAVVGGLIFLGASAWLIIGIVLGVLAYFSFVSFLFFRYLENGFRLEPGWWLLLLILLGGGITGLILLIGLNPISSLIIMSMLYFALGLIAVVFLVFIIVAFFKALFSPFIR